MDFFTQEFVLLSSQSIRISFGTQLLFFFCQKVLIWRGGVKANLEKVYDLNYLKLFGVLN